MGETGSVESRRNVECEEQHMTMMMGISVGRNVIQNKCSVCGALTKYYCKKCPSRTGGWHPYFCEECEKSHPLEHTFGFTKEVEEILPCQIQ